MLIPSSSERSGRVLAAETILAFLSDSQYLHPHQSLDQVLREAVDTAGVCPDAIAQSLQWLQLNAAQSLGRLRRTELVQLARSIHRFWRQAVMESQAVPSAR